MPFRTVSSKYITNGGARCGTVLRNAAVEKIWRSLKAQTLYSTCLAREARFDRVRVSKVGVS